MNTIVEKATCILPLVLSLTGSQLSVLTKHMIMLYYFFDIQETSYSNLEHICLVCLGFDMVKYQAYYLIGIFTCMLPFHYFLKASQVIIAYIVLVCFINPFVAFDLALLYAIGVVVPKTHKNVIFYLVLQRISYL
jgi:hypothetical protein